MANSNGGIANHHSSDNSQHGVAGNGVNKYLDADLVMHYVLVLGGCLRFDSTLLLTMPSFAATFDFVVQAYLTINAVDLSRSILHFFNALVSDENTRFAVPVV